MVEEDRYCIDVLIQISAIQAALDKIALGLLDDHARHCLVGDGEGADGPDAQADELMAAVGRIVSR
jgi:DNA-binding FrmR family transcriptional regulator